MNNMSQENIAYNLYKMGKLESSLGGLFIKLILSGVAVYFESSHWGSNIAETITLNVFFFSFVYLVCSIFQISLKLTGNYIVAAIVFVGIFMGAFWIVEVFCDLFLNRLAENPFGEYVAILFLSLLFSIPFFFDVRNVIVLIKMKRNFKMQ